MNRSLINPRPSGMSCRPSSLHISHEDEIKKSTPVPRLRHAMKKNGHTAAGSQRWRRRVCRMGTTVRRDDPGRVAQPDEFLAWLPGREIPERHGYVRSGTAH